MIKYGFPRLSFNFDINKVKEKLPTTIIRDTVNKWIDNLETFSMPDNIDTEVCPFTRCKIDKDCIIDTCAFYSEEAKYNCCCIDLYHTLDEKQTVSPIEDLNKIRQIYGYKHTDKRKLINYSGLAIGIYFYLKTVNNVYYIDYFKGRCNNEFYSFLFYLIPDYKATIFFDFVRDDFVGFLEDIELPEPFEDYIDFDYILKIIY